MILLLIIVFFLLLMSAGNKRVPEWVTQVLGYLLIALLIVYAVRMLVWMPF
jgi:hypothetical protein